MRVSGIVTFILNQTYPLIYVNKCIFSVLFDTCVSSFEEQLNYEKNPPYTD